MYTIGYTCGGKRTRATIDGQPAPDFDSPKAARDAINALEWDERVGMVPVNVDYIPRAIQA